MNETWAETVVNHLLETDASFDNYIISELRYLTSRKGDERFGGVGYDTNDRVGFIANPNNLVHSPTRVIMSLEDAIQCVEDAIRIKEL